MCVFYFVIYSKLLLIGYLPTTIENHYTRGIMVIIVGNGHGYMSSNPGRD